MGRYIKKDIEHLGGASNWKDLALDIVGWKLGCDGMVLKAQ
jgi:hypothetical protein